MATTQRTNDALEHGTIIYKRKNTVKGKYCSKEVTGLSCLKQRLGGVGMDVLACEEVPQDVKTQMRNTLPERKNNMLRREVLQLFESQIPWKVPSKSTILKRGQHDINQATATGKRKHTVMDSVLEEDMTKNSVPSSPPKVPVNVKEQMRNTLPERKNNMLRREVLQLFESGTPCKVPSKSTILKRGQHDSNQATATGKRKHVVMDSVQEENMTKNSVSSSPPNIVLDLHDAAKTIKVEENSSRDVKRCIARFFYEYGIDPGAAKAPTFQKMVDAITESGSTRFEIPSCDELSGSIFQDEMKDVQRYVKKVRESWRKTGCSILLDGWTDEKGRSLINFLVDSPAGPIFLKSTDISGSLDNVNVMMSLLDGVIKDVGVEHVVQVTTYTTSGCMVEVGKKLMEKHRTIFWTVCASHCISLMLEKIEMMDSIKEVLNKAKTVTRFLYSDTTLLRLVRKYTQGQDLVMPSRIKSTIPFLTLEKIVFETVNLRNLFSSSEWETSKWACMGRRVVDLVEDTAFWLEARDVLIETIPLVRSLLLINGGDKRPQVPYIYETMDQVKETIKEGFKNKIKKYKPVWDIIDGMWNNILHSPLHSAGYFLNPSFFYSGDFVADAEVASGLLCCIVRMVEDRNIQDIISLQIEEYRAAKGSFGAKKAVDERTTVPPATWWSLYGGHCPELQKFAIRILSQTCCGGSRFDLNKTSSEKLHKKGTNPIEQEKLKDGIFVHYNLQLQNSVSVNSNDSSVSLGDWVLEEEEEEEVVGIGNGDSVWTELDEDIIRRGVASSFEPKEESL